MDPGNSFQSFLNEEISLPCLPSFRGLAWATNPKKGSILLGKCLENEQELSIKVLSCSKIEEVDMSYEVLTSLQSLQHPNICPLVNIQTSKKEEPYLVYYGTELAETTLSDEFLEKQKFSFLDALNILYGIAHALFSVKSKFNFFHGRVKPANIYKSQGSYKIANFENFQGSKLNNSHHDLSTENVRSMLYIAPEQKDTEASESQNIDYFACDVFSLGVLAFELFKQDTHVIRAISPRSRLYQQELAKMVATVKKEVNRELGNLLETMVSLEPYNRPHIDQVTETLANIIETYSQDSKRTLEIEAGYNLVADGEVFYEKLEYRAALACFNTFLSILQKWNGKPSDIAHACDKIGIIQFALGENMESFENLKFTLHILRSLYGMYHPNIGDVLTNIAKLHLVTQKYEEALLTAKEAIAVYKETEGPNSSEEGQVLILMGHIYKAKKEFIKAKEVILKSLEINAVFQSEDCPEVADLLELLGVISSDLNEPEKALIYHQKSLSIRIETLSANHPRISNSYRNLGRTYLQMKDPKTGISLLEMALKIWKVNFSKDHPETQLLQLELGQEYLKSGNTKKALELLGALENQDGSVKTRPSGKFAQKLYVYLAEAHKKAGNSKKSDEFIQKARKSFQNAI